MASLRLAIARVLLLGGIACGVEACDGGPTTLLLEIDGPSSVSALDLTVSLATGASVQRSLPLGTDGTALPGNVVVVLPDVATVVTIHLEALVEGAPREADASVTSRPHRQVRVPLSLAGPSDDLGGSDLVAPADADLTMPSGDLAGADLAVPGDLPAADLLGTDLVPALPALSIVVGKHGGGGTHDDVGEDARFQNLNGIVLIGTTAYVTEYWSGALRTVDVTTGQTGTLALTRLSDDQNTRLDTPSGIAYDGVGALYTTSYLNHIVEKVDLATGKVSRVLGEPGAQGGQDGDLSMARFDHPMGLDFDASGNLWVADQGNEKLRKITFGPQPSVSSPALVSSIGGLDMGTPIVFSFMRSVRFLAGRLYVTASGGVYRIDPTTTPMLATVLIPLDKLQDAGDLTISGDSLYVTDASLGAVWRFPLATPLPGSLFAGENTFSAVSLDGVGTSARLQHGRWLANDGAGNVYFSEHHTVRRLAIGSAQVTTIAGRGNHAGTTSMPPRLDGPFGVVFDGNDTFYITDFGGNTVRRWVRSTNTLSTVAGSGSYDHKDDVGTNAAFWAPRGITRDGNGNLYVADSSNHCLRKITSGGVVTTIVGHAKVQGDAQPTNDLNGADIYLRYPDGLAYDGDQTLFLADSGNGVVLRISLVDTTYKTSIVAGNPAVRGHKNGVGQAAELDGPRGLFWDGANQILYFTDAASDTVRRIDLTNAAMPTVSTISGIPYSPFDVSVPAGDNGALSGTRHRSPSGIVVVGSVLYVANQDGESVQRLDLMSQMSTTVLGAAMQGFVRPGGLPARIHEPAGMVATAAGIYLVSPIENVLMLAVGVP